MTKMEITIQKKPNHSYEPTFREDFERRWETATDTIKEYCVTVKKPKPSFIKTSSGLMYIKRKEGKHNG